MVRLWRLRSPPPPPPPDKARRNESSLWKPFNFTVHYQSKLKLTLRWCGRGCWQARPSWIEELVDCVQWTLRFGAPGQRRCRRPLGPRSSWATQMLLRLHKALLGKQSCAVYNANYTCKTFTAGPNGSGHRRAAAADLHGAHPKHPAGAVPSPCPERAAGPRRGVSVATAATAGTF